MLLYGEDMSGGGGLQYRLRSRGFTQYMSMTMAWIPSFSRISAARLA